MEMSFVIRDYVCIFSRSRHIRLFNLYKEQNKGQVTEEDFNNHIKEKFNPYLEQGLSKYVHDNKGQVTEEDMDNFLVQRNIIFDFENNVKGKNFKNENNKHDGDEGHWLERQFGVKTNSDNAPDRDGWEMKKESNVYSFVDKTPTNKILEGINIKKKGDTKNKERFWNMFQRTDSEGIRIGGWKLDKWDIDGQCLQVDEYTNVVVLYNYLHDKRKNKNELVSEYYKDNKSHKIISWDKEDVEKAINNKWNKKGFIICKKNKQKVYNKICFGHAISFDYWIKNVQQQNIYYDGYSKLGGRWRGSFRTSSKWLDKHITEEY